jgi:hypothetical protein
VPCCGSRPVEHRATGKFAEAQSKRVAMPVLGEGAALRTMASLLYCAASDYAGTGCLTFLSRPMRAGPPLTISECTAFTALLEDLMLLVTSHAEHIMATARFHGPVATTDLHHGLHMIRTTRDMFITRLVAARGHCDTTFGSSATAPMRCDFHILLGAVAQFSGCSRQALVQRSARRFALQQQQQWNALLARWAGAVPDATGVGRAR